MWTYLVENSTDSTSSPATAESPSPSQTGSDQSLTAKSTDTLRQCCSPEWEMEPCPQHLSGTMCERCRHLICRRSISSPGVSRARISQLQALVQAWEASEVDFSTNCVEWSKKYLHPLCSLKTSQPLELEGCSLSYVSLPIWGMTVGGLVYLPQKLEPRTCAKGGSCWQSPIADDAINRKAGKWNSRGEPKLSAQVKLWPTPTARDYKGGRKPETLAAAGRKPSNSLPDKVNHAEQTTGQLNPTWVEWLMGLPTGWTELKPWAMEWFGNKPAKPSPD